MRYVASHPHAFAGRSVGSGHCVAFVQQACGAPHTSRWARGLLARGSGCEQGTAIATFDADGRYGNHTDGRSHAAILIQEDDHGLWVWDQWRGHAVAKRLIRWRGGQGKRVNDGDAFHIIEG